MIKLYTNRNIMKLFKNPSKIIQDLSNYLSSKFNSMFYKKQLVASMSVTPNQLLKNIKAIVLLAMIFIGVNLQAANEFQLTATGGTTAANYNTLGAAFAAINAGTHTGAIVISISATPAASETAACVLNSTGAGSASYTSLIIRPIVDNVTVSGPTVTGRGLIELNGADNVTIDGDNPNTAGTNKNLSITNTAATTVTFTSVIRIATSTLITTTNNITIKNCNLTGSGVSFNSSANTSFTTTQAGTNVIFAGAGASTAAVTTAPSALSGNVQNSASGQTWTNLIIDNNNINSAGKGICLGGTTDDVCPILTITNNIIGNPTAGATNQIYWRGISINGGVGSAVGSVISGNTFYVESYCGSTSAPYGPAAIDLGRINGTTAATARRITIENNKILRVKQNNTGGYPAFGIILQVNNNITVRNNFIQNVLNVGATSFSTSYGAQGIFVSTGNNHNIYHNTISLTGADAGTGNLITCLSFAGVATTGCDVRNNIFSNTCTSASTSSSFVNVFFTTTPTAGMALVMNNNAYYTGSTASLHGIGQVTTTKSAANLYTVANFNPAATTPATNFRSITNVSTAGNDNASIGSTSAAPFISGTDLHLNTSASNIADVEQKGATGTGASTDIDGETRPNTGTTLPDIGADEVATVVPPVISFTSISPNTNQCSATARVVTVSITTSSGTVSGANLNYNNGSAGSVAMTNTTGTTWTGTIPAASPTNTTVTWSITATNSLGGSATYNGATYQDNPNFGVTATATATPTSVCSGTPTSLSVSVVGPGPLNVTLGAGALTSSGSGGSSVTYASPYSHYYGALKTQYVIRAAELTALGLSAGNITALGFNVTTAGTTYSGFSISLGATASTVATNPLLAPTFTSVYSSNVTPVVGVNTYNFSTPFAWNGTSNIVVQICWGNNNGGGTAAEVKYDNTAFVATAYYATDNLTGPVSCSSASGTSSGTRSTRPQMYITGNATSATLTPTAYVWSDGVSTVGITNPLSQSPSTNTSYTVTATVNSCPVVSNTVAVSAQTLPTAPTATNSAQCGTQVPTASIADPNGFTTPTFVWYADNVTTTPLQTSTSTTYLGSISSTTIFYVSVKNPATPFCESTRTAVTVTVTSPDPITAYAGGSGTSGGATTPPNINICLGASLNLYVIQTGSTNSYTYTWSSPTSGNGITTNTGNNISVTPTATGTFVYTISGVDGSCTATSTVTVVVNDVPSITTNLINASIVAGANTSFTTVATNTPTSYVWEVNDGSGWTTVTNGGVYSNATTATLNLTAVPFTMNGYQYRVTAVNGCGSSTPSTVATLTVNYCTPTGFATSSAYWITNFTTTAGLTNINNTSGAGTPSGYSNFTAQSCSQFPGSSINFSISTNTSSHYFYIWIDWNNDGDFADAGEAVVTSTATFLASYSGSYVVPAGQAAGSYRMRIANNWSVTILTACGPAPYGEYEDYTFTVVIPAAPTITALSSNTGCAGSSLTITGTNLLGATAANVTIGGTPVSSITSNTGTSMVVVVASGSGLVSVTTPGGTATSASLVPSTFTVIALPTVPVITGGASQVCVGSSTTPFLNAVPGGSWTITAGTGTATVDALGSVTGSSAGTVTLNYTVTTGTPLFCSTTVSTGITVITIPAATGSPSPANNATGVCYGGASPVTSLSWGAVASATSYDVYFGTSATPPQVSSAQTATNYSTGTLLPSTQYYWKVVAKNSCGDAVSAVTWTFTTNAAPCYCTSTSTSNTGRITAFSTTAGVTNITNTGSGYSTNGYGDFTSLSASQNLSTSINYSATINSIGLGVGFAIFVDWNQDGDFTDAGENVYNSSGYIYANPTGSFTVPGTAAIGSTRMRIVSNYDSGTPVSCNSGITGETEDYTFIVLATPCSGTPTGGTITGNPICVSGAAKLTASGYTSGLSGLSYQWETSPNGTSSWTSISGQVNPASATTAVITTTTYYRLRVTCTPSSSIAYSNVLMISVNTPSITSTKDSSRCGNGTITLEATGSAGTTVRWYDAATAGNLVGTGSPFTTTSLSATTTYYAAAEVSSAAINGTIGAGASATTGSSGLFTSLGISPFTHLYGGYKSQILITSAELTAAGLSAGTFNSLAFNVTSAGTTYTGFNLNIGSTSATNLTDFATPTFTNVYNGNITPSTGFYSIPFSTAYQWDGTSNIILQLCWSNNNDGGTSAEVRFDETSNNSMVSYEEDDVLPGDICAGNPADYYYTAKPQIRFNATPVCSSSPRTAVVATVIQTVPTPTLNITSSSICKDSIVKLYTGGSSISGNTTLFSENFEDGTLGNFTRVDSTGHNPAGASWAVQSSPYDIPTLVWDATINSGSSKFALTNSDFNTTVNYVNTSLESGVINTTSFTTLALTFRHFYSDFSTAADHDIARIEVSTNGGTSWTSVQTYTTNQGAEGAFASVNINLAAYVNQTNLKFRFKYVSKWDDGWAIDDVVLSGMKNLPAIYTWSPSTNLFIDAAATTPYNSTTYPNRDTVYAKPTDTTTYTVSASSVTPVKCASTNTVTINVSQIPVANLDAVKPYLCDGSALLSASSVSPTSTTFNWVKFSGTGIASVVGNPATVTGLSGTTIYNALATNGVCVDKLIGKDTIVTQPTNSVVATSPSPGVSVCNYCVYQNGNTKTYYNSTDGKIVASITDDASVNSSLDETEMCFKVNGAVQTVTDNLGNEQPYLQRTWTIHPTAGTKSTVTLYFTNAELLALQAAANGGVYQFSGYDLWITKYSGGQNGVYTGPASTGGVSVPAVFSAYGSDHKVEFTVDNFSTFYIHPSLFPFSALPVEFVSFTGLNVGNVNQLEWITASELNSSKFVVEKSLDGNSFTYIGEKPAAGNSNHLITYNFNDNNPVVGNNYYRLKIIDLDGTFTYSNIVNIPIGEVLSNSFARVYPNPTAGKLNVEIQSTANFDTKLAVYDIVGTKIYEKSVGLVKGLNTVDCNFSTMAQGAYVLHFTDNNGKIHTTKFIKE